VLEYLSRIDHNTAERDRAEAIRPSIAGCPLQIQCCCEVWGSLHINLCFPYDEPAGLCPRLRLIKLILAIGKQLFLMWRIGWLATP
jgi:hypothetical protein